MQSPFQRIDCRDQESTTHIRTFFSNGVTHLYVNVKCRVMKVAIFGDIHGNLEALEAVLEDAASQGVDDHVCLGDVVGYGADPKACIARVRALDCPVVKGNHDEDASLNQDLYGRSRLAQAAMHWTREELGPEEKRWLEELPMMTQLDDFTVVHASLSIPETWTYVLSGQQAESSFSFQETPVCFIGHTHTPITYVRDNEDGSVSAESASAFSIEADKDYLINVGSTGQPRDREWRSSYAIYDLNASKVAIRRVEYDIDTACLKIQEAGLPLALAERLRLGR